MGLLKSISKATGGIIPSSFKGAVKNSLQLGAAALTGGTSLGVTGLGDTSLFGGIVQGAIGLGQDYLQSQVNMNNQKELAAYAAGKQNELNEAAYQRNLQQWNLENAYNSPAAQMQRFVDAGLNPNLIYDQQNTSANSPTLQPATYDPGHYQPVDKSAQRQALQIALLEHAQRIENQAIENDLARQRLLLAARDADRSDMLARAQVQAIGANLGLTNARIYDLNDRIQSGYKSDIGKYWHDIKKIFKGSALYKGTGGPSAELF